MVRASSDFEAIFTEPNTISRTPHLFIFKHWYILIYLHAPRHLFSKSVYIITLCYHRQINPASVSSLSSVQVKQRNYFNQLDLYFQTKQLNKKLPVLFLLLSFSCKQFARWYGVASKGIFIESMQLKELNSIVTLSLYFKFLSFSFFFFTNLNVVFINIIL